MAAQGKYTYLTRWRRERDRSPEIDAIAIGQSVSRDWGGKVHTVTCGNGYWIYEDRKYPTLYKVVCAIVGEREFPRADGKTRTMCNWSASRFFRLNDLGS